MNFIYSFRDTNQRSPDSAYSTVWTFYKYFYNVFRMNGLTCVKWPSYGPGCAYAPWLSEYIVNRYILNCENIGDKKRNKQRNEHVDETFI